MCHSTPSAKLLTTAGKEVIGMVISIKGTDCEEVGRQLAKNLRVHYYHIGCPGDFPPENEDTHELWQKNGKLCIVSGDYSDVLAGTVIRLYIYDTSTQPNRDTAAEQGLPPRFYWYDLCINSESLDIPGTIELVNQFVALKLMRRHPARKHFHAESREEHHFVWNGLDRLFDFEIPL